MFEWNEMVQMMVDWVDRNIEATPTLIEMSNQLGFSPYYCSNQFHLLTGMTLRDYICMRKISRAALELRDTDGRIIDIAVKYGFSSQEAFTRAFVKTFEITPNAYRKDPKPIPLAIRQEVFLPYHYLMKERDRMSSSNLKEAEIKIERIPAHKFIGIWDIDSSKYGDFWYNGRHDCDEVCGTLESMSNYTLSGQLTQMAGWFYKNGKKGYFYGIPVSKDFNSEIPEGMECKEIPESEYLVFFHPPFDYLKDNDGAMSIVEDVAWSFDATNLGYEWDEESKPDYQRHFPEKYGYAVLRPVRKL